MGEATDPLFFIMEIAERVREIVAGYLEEHGIELVEVIYRRESRGMVVRLFVDMPEGIPLAACEAVNRFLSARLEEENVIDQRYVVEVSSPGLDRRLTTDNDFRRVMGKDLEIETTEPVDGKRHLEGLLIGINAAEVVLESGDISTVVPRDKVAMARLKIRI